MEVINQLIKFDFNSVSPEWVQSVWSREYIDIPDPPSDYADFLKSLDIVTILSSTNRALRSWYKIGKPDSAVSTEVGDSPNWKQLISADVQPKALTALLCHLINVFEDQQNSDIARQICINTSSLYFLLLGIRGSTALQIFHPTLFAKAVDTFKMKKLIHLNKKNTSRNQSGGRLETDQGAMADQFRSLFDIIDEPDLPVRLEPHEKLTLIKGLNYLIHDLLLSLNSMSLKNNEPLIDHCVEQLVDLTRLETEHPEISFGQFISKAGTKSIAHNAYVCLKHLCNDSHGYVEQTVKRIMRHCLPSVLMNKLYGWELSLQELNVISIHTIHFIHYLRLLVGQPTYLGIMILMQHLAKKIPDRAEYRQKGAVNLVKVMSCLPDSQYSEFMVWLFKFAHNEKAAHRLFALEVMSLLLYEEERVSEERPSASKDIPVKNLDDCDHENMEVDCTRDDTGTTISDADVSPVFRHTDIFSDVLKETAVPIQKREIALQRYLLAVLFSRCFDMSASVRAKALSAIIGCIKANNAIIDGIMKEIFVDSVPDFNVDEVGPNDRGFLSHDEIVKFLETARHRDPLPGAKAIVSKLEILMTDEKVFVRKGALELLQHIIELNQKLMTSKLLNILSQHCRDPALMIRKQVVQSLTAMTLKNPDHPVLPKLVVENILPQISDADPKIQEKVLEALQELILANLVPYPKTRTARHHLPWVLIDHTLKMKMQKCLHTLCEVWSKANTLRPMLIPVIESHIGTKNDIPAWLFLSCVAAYVPIKNPMNILNHYKTAVSDENAVRVTIHWMLEVLFHCWVYLPSSVREEWCGQMMQRLYKFQVKPVYISATMDIVTVIRKRENTSVRLRHVWAEKLFEDSAKLLDCLLPTETQLPDTELFIRRLFTLGETAQLMPWKAKLTKFHLLIDFVFCSQRGVKEQLKTTRGVMPLAIVTLGKLSLLDEKVAQKVVPQLGKLLSELHDAAPRVNVVCVLADLCTRYTAMVDPLLPQMFLCLKDDSSIVREKTAVLLIQLLQEDYLKLKGAFYYHILTVLCDTKPIICNLISYYLTETLIPKNTSLMYQNFVESLFHYNNYEGHKSYCLFAITAEEKRRFDLSGRHHLSSRRALYRFMLEHMDDEDRFKTMYNLASNVIAEVANGKVLLSAAGAAVVQDAFYCLTSEEIRLSGVQIQTDDDPVDTEELATAVLNKAKKTILSKCVKKNVIQFVVPAILQLKRKLVSSEAYRYLLPDLMSTLRCLVQDYKNEVEEIFAEDEVTGAEVLYDINQYEEEQRRRRGSSYSEESTVHESDKSDDIIEQLQEILPPSCNIFSTPQRPLPRLSALYNPPPNPEEGAVELDPDEASHGSADDRLFDQGQSDHCLNEEHSSEQQ